MVLDSLISPLHAEKRPDEMILFGFIFATIAILLSLWVFPSYASFAMVTFTVMAVLPLMVQIMRFEKEKQEKAKVWKVLTHTRVVRIFIFLFLGFLLAFTLWFLLLPVEVANNLFFLQINTITEINSATGSAIFSSSPFWIIFLNNLRILGLSMLFSFIFGSGAIFILTWNASVLGVAMANFIKIAVASGSSSAGYFAAFSFAAVRYLIHGLPEMVSFFIAGLAGAIISFTLLDYKIGMKKFLPRLKGSLNDAGLLMVVAFVLLMISAGIEVSITPLFTR